MKNKKRGYEKKKKVTNKNRTWEIRAWSRIRRRGLRRSPRVVRSPAFAPGQRALLEKLCRENTSRTPSTEYEEMA